ncbi:MAG: cyclic pyranopterin monophosphate synthase MoaC [Terrimicrobiaceae bacterium]
MSLSDFSHLDPEGTARMVDVSEKPVQRRTAVASGFIQLALATIDALKQAALPKGDVLTVARIAAIQAAKQTAVLIPLCHQLPLERVDVQFEVQERGVLIRATVVTSSKTGVEMEALTAVSIAGLTIFDMCKAVDKGMVLGAIRVDEKVKA